MEQRNIIFLPGLMCDERLFEIQMADLSRAGYNCQYGDITRAATISGMADEILQDAPETFALVGLSMGGIVALEILRKAPNRVTHLALLNTTAAADSKQLMRKAQRRRVADGELQDVMREELKPEYLAKSNRTVELLSVIYDMCEGLGKDIFARQNIALMGRKDSKHLLPNIKCPTLVLTGRDDDLCTPAMHQDMAAAIENSSLHILSNCGHLSTIERPKAVSNALLDLLAIQNDTTHKDIKSAKHLRLVSSAG